MFTELTALCPTRKDNNILCYRTSYFCFSAIAVLGTVIFSLEEYELQNFWSIVQSLEHFSLSSHLLCLKTDSPPEEH